MSSILRPARTRVFTGTLLCLVCCSHERRDVSDAVELPRGPIAMTAGAAEPLAGQGAAEVEPAQAGRPGPQPAAAGSAGTQESIAASNGGAGAPAGRSAAGSSAAGTAAGSGGAVAAGTGGAAPFAAFALSAVGAAALGADEVAFPASALPPMNQSPELSWSGVPAGAKSLALVFTDVSGGAVKWVVWDIPISVTRLPPDISDVANPSEVPGSSQIGSLGNQGYAGPCCPGNRYEFVLWAIDVEKLPGAQRLSTYQLRDLISEHDLAMTPPVKMRIMR